MLDQTKRSIVRSTIYVTIAGCVLALVGSLLPLEVKPLGTTLGALVIGGLIYCLALVYVLTATPQQALLAVAALTAIGVIAVPNFGAPLGLKLAVPIICLSLALPASRREVRTARTTWWPTLLIGLYLAYTVVSAVAFNSVEGTKESALLVVTLLPLAFVLPRLTHHTMNQFLFVVVVLACIEAILAMLEVLDLVKPVWGLLGGDVPAWGVENHLLPTEAVRGMGSLAHPIPLGMLCAFGVLFLFICRRIRGPLLLVPLTILVGGILASGTRSALVAFIAIVLGAIATSNSRLDWFKVLTIAAVGAICALGVNTAALLGTSDVTGTVSFIHRAQAIQVLPAVWSGDLSRLVFGTNPDISRDLASLDYLKASGIDAIDNQWISLLIDYGLVGVILVACVIGSMLLTPSWPRRIAAVAFVLSTLSFDVISWNVGLLLLFVIAQHSFGTPAPATQVAPRSLVEARSS